MAQKITCQTTDGSLSISLLAAPYSITVDGIDRGEASFTDAGKVKERNGEPTTAADRNLRSMGWTQQIDEDTLDLLNAAYADLKAIICQPQWVLVLNAGGATEADRYYDCYAVTSVPKFTSRLVLTAFHRYDIRFEAKPFSRGPAVTLPRNLVVDPGMNEDFSGDGVCNSFVDANSGASKPTYTLSIDTGGWQKIDVTAGGGVDQYGGVSQVISVVAGNVMSFRFSYKTSAALTNCRVQSKLYFNDSGPTIKQLLDAATPTTTEIEVKLENYTVPAGATTATLYFLVNGTAAGMVGTFYVHKAMIITAAALPTGADGGTLVYGTQVVQSPATLPLDNLPGDAGALSTISLIANDNTGTPGEKDKFTLGVTSDTEQWLIKSFTGTANADCLGGQCYDMTTAASATVGGIVLKGTYYVFVRIMSTGSLNLPMKAGQAPAGASTASAAYYTPPITVYSVASKWELDCLGILTFPLADYVIADPTNRVTITSTAGTGSQYIDYAIFIPVWRGFCRAEFQNDSAGTTLNKHGVILDNIQNSSSLTLSERSGSAEYDNYPFAGSTVNPVAQSSIFSEFVFGRDNKIAISASRGSTAATTLDIISPAVLTVRYAPLYLE